MDQRGVRARDQTPKEGLRRAPAGDGAGSSMAGARIGRIPDDRAEVGGRDARRTLGIHREV